MLPYRCVCVCVCGTAGLINNIIIADIDTRVPEQRNLSAARHTQIDGNNYVCVLFDATTFVRAFMIGWVNPPRRSRLF